MAKKPNSGLSATSAYEEALVNRLLRKKYSGSLAGDPYAVRRKAGGINPGRPRKPPVFWDGKSKTKYPTP